MLDCSKQASRVPFFCPPLWALGVIGLPLAHWCLFAKIEPFYTPIYAYLWWSFIFTVDFLVFLVRKRSMLQERPREFLLLTLWSTPVWLRDGPVTILHLPRDAEDSLEDVEHTLFHDRLLQQNDSPRNNGE
jgi:hypothetical protein